MSTLGFYRAFEDRHRGPRELIRARLEAYQPFITPLLEVYQPAAAIDLGCGRGEWLELLQDSGFEPHGVDLDDGMLEACTELGLSVTEGDAVEFLASLEDESQAIVSGFHIAEHISFEALDSLVKQALRVLKPGGLLILETPNPENLVVGTCNFYLDPTHIRPIPPALLSFLPEYHGYCRTRVVRLQEDKSLQERKENIELFNVLDGVSPDYAVVAQKTAEKDALTKFEAAFDAPHGIQLHQLAGRYDQKIERTANELADRLTTVEAQAPELAEAVNRIATLAETMTQLAGRVDRAESRATSAEAMQQDLQVQVEQFNNQVHHWWQQASQLEQERNALRQSWSWRITAPLRSVAGLVIHPVTTFRGGANRVVHRSIEAFQRPLSRFMAAILRRPKLSYRVNQLLLRYPALHQQLLGVAQRQGLDAGSPNSLSPTTLSEKNTDSSLESLSPRARQIHADLVAAIEKNKTGT